MATRKQNIYEAINGALQDLGLGALSGWANQQVKQGYAFDAILARMREQDAYKKRFAANEQRIKNGLPPLDERTYLATEQQFRQTMKAAGMPSGMYDKPEDFHKFIAQDVSVQEVADRVKIAEDAVNNWDPQTKKALKQYYGIGTKALTAWALDPKRALPQLQKLAEVAEMGGAVRDAGFGGVNGKWIEELRDSGVDKDQLFNAAASAKDKQDSYKMMTAVEGGKLDKKDMIGAELGTDAAAKKKFKGMAARERARFEGTGGATGGTFSRGTGAGSF